MSEGDVTVGDHRLCLGDCLDVLPTLPAGSVDMVLADLPYGATSNPWDCAVPLPELWAELLRVGTPRCAFLFTSGQPFTSRLVASALANFRYSLVWNKIMASRWLQAKTKPLSVHEDICVFYRNLPHYTPQMVLRDKVRVMDRTADRQHGSSNYTPRPTGHRKSLGIQKYTHRYPTTLLSFVRPSRTLHPTQKPVELLAWLLRTYSAPGATVLDPTSGVASTAVAAQRTGRRSISMERDPNYYAKGVARVRDEVAGVAPVPKPKRAPKPAVAAQRALWG